MESDAAVRSVDHKNLRYTTPIYLLEDFLVILDLINQFFLLVLLLEDRYKNYEDTNQRYRQDPPKTVRYYHRSQCNK